MTNILGLANSGWSRGRPLTCPGPLDMGAPTVYRARVSGPGRPRRGGSPMSTPGPGSSLTGTFPLTRPATRRLLLLEFLILSYSANNFIDFIF